MYEFVPGPNLYIIKRVYESIESFTSSYLVDRRILRNFFLAWPVKELSMSSYRICIVAKFLCDQSESSSNGRCPARRLSMENSNHSSKNNCEERFNILPETSEIVIVTYQEAGDSDQVLCACTVRCVCLLSSRIVITLSCS